MANEFDDIELGGQALELNIVNPDMVTLDDGSVEITLIPDEGPGDIATAPFDASMEIWQNTLMTGS